MDAAFAKVAAVTVISDAGDVSVTGSDRAGADLHADLVWEAERKPTVTPSMADDHLTVTVRCPQGDGRCSANLTLAVPRGSVVSMRTLLGNLAARAVSGELTMDTGVGKVTADAVDSPSVSTTARAGDVSVAVGQGTSRLTARGQTGNVRIRVPAGQAYRVTATAMTGKTTIDIPVNDSSSRSIQATTMAGDINLSPA